MRRLVLLQFTATLVASVIAGLLAGQAALFSTLLGGLCCAVPNALFALRLYINALRGYGGSVATFFIGEFIKVALTVALLTATAWLYHDLNWLALLAGVVVALKSYLILLFRR
jgi:ATP synthase protein I